MAVKYETLKEASKAENIPLEIIKESRKYNPTCFNHGRVIDWEPVADYISKHYEALEKEAAETLDALKRERLRQQITRDNYSFDIEKKRFIEKEVVLQRITEIANTQKLILKSALTEELPARLVGLSQNDILLHLEKVFANVCKEMSAIKI